MDKNSKITSTYKAEITEILSRVSEGLSKKVTDSIDPKIHDIATSVKSHIDLVQLIKDENEKSSDKLKEIVRNLDSTVNYIRSASENMEKSIEHRNETIISAIEQNSEIISQYDKTITDNLFSEIQKLSDNEKYTTIETKIVELYTNQQTIQKLIYVIIALLLLLLITGITICL